MHNKCYVFESSEAIPRPLPQSVEKLSSMKPVLDARKVGDHWDTVSQMGQEKGKVYLVSI